VGEDIGNYYAPQGWKQILYGFLYILVSWYNQTIMRPRNELGIPIIRPTIQELLREASNDEAFVIPYKDGNDVLACVGDIASLYRKIDEETIVSGVSLSKLRSSEVTFVSRKGRTLVEATRNALNAWAEYKTEKEGIRKPHTTPETRGKIIPLRRR